MTSNARDPRANREGSALSRENSMPFVERNIDSLPPSGCPARIGLGYREKVKGSPCSQKINGPPLTVAKPRITQRTHFRIELQTAHAKFVPRRGVALHHQSR